MAGMVRARRFLVSVCALTAVVLTAASQAQTQTKDEMTWYAIEVIVFERTSDLGRIAEAWPTEPGLPSLADALELSVEGIAVEDLARNAQGKAPPETGSAPALRAFRLVPREEYRLVDAWNRLNKSSAYRPLLHVAWIQPGFTSEEARLVHVRNNNAALGAITASVGEGGGTLPAFDIAGDAAGDVPTLSSRIRLARDPSRAAFDGTLRVHRARYLHVQADLLYYRPLAADARAPLPSDDDPNAAPAPDSPDTALIEQLLAEEDSAPRLFRLMESRRMRSRELHYLDHPLFGMLVEAWPVELPEAPSAPVEAAPPAQGDVTTDERGGGVQPP